MCSHLLSLPHKLYLPKTQNDLRGESLVPSLIRRRPLHVNRSLLIHNRILQTRLHTLGVDLLNLQRTQTLWVGGNPDDRLFLPQGGVVKGTIMEARGVAVFGAGHSIFIRRVGGAANLGLDRRRVGNGGGVVHKNEVRLGESEPVDVTLEDSNADDHHTLMHTYQLLQSKPDSYSLTMTTPHPKPLLDLFPF